MALDARMRCNVIDKTANKAPQRAERFAHSPTSCRYQPQVGYRGRRTLAVQMAFHTSLALQAPGTVSPELKNPAFRPDF